MLEGYAADFSASYPAFPLRIESFLSGYDLLETVRLQGGYDLYLLDVLMPHLNGIELARRLRERGEVAELLFLTVSREYAVEAFGVKAAGYLLKPIQRADFNREVLGCLHRLTLKDNPALLFKTREGLRKVHVREIVTIESFTHRRVCTLADGRTFETAATLSSLYERLQAYPRFFLPHRAYIVNLDYVGGLTSTDLLMTDGRRIPVSRKLYARLREVYLDSIF